MIAHINQSIGRPKRARATSHPPINVLEDSEEQVETMQGICGEPSCASYLWWPFLYVVRDPKETGIIFLLGTSLFGTIGKLSSVIAYYVTWFGVVLLGLFLIWWFILFAARGLAFPGHLSLVKRQLENEVTKRASQIHSSALEDATTFGLLKLKENNPNFLSQLKIIRYHFEQNLQVTKKVLLRVQTVNRLSSSGTQYLSALEDLLTLYEEHMQPTVDALLSTTGTTTSMNQRQELMSVIDTKRSTLTRHVQALMELRETLFHVPPTEEEGGGGGGRDDDDNDGEDDVDEHMEAGQTSENSSSSLSISMSSHWLIKFGMSVVDLFTSWRAARAPLDTVINMAYLRYELMERYNAVEKFVDGDVDSVYFPPRGDSHHGDSHHDDSHHGDSHHDDVHGDVHAGNLHETSSPSKIVLICFPNAGILEFVHYQSDWIPFYLNQNFAVVLTNYRGYGLERNGLPSPSAIKSDASKVLEKLVSLYPTAKIMVHGESMGGMVACSLASKYPLHVSLAYVDRTFSDLPSAGSSLLKMNFVAKYGPWILPWKTDNVEAWLSIDCPKMCANDPNDTMIHEKSALKEGVTNEVIKRSLLNGDAWSSDERRRLPLWNDEKSEESGESGESGQAAEMLVGAWRALKTLLQASAVRDPILMRRVLREVHNCDGRQNKTLGNAMNQDLDAVRCWAKTLLVWGPVAVVPDVSAVHTELLQRTVYHLQQRGMSPSQAEQMAVQNVNSNMPVPLEQVHRSIQEAVAKGAAGAQGKEAMDGLHVVISDLYIAYKAREEMLASISAEGTQLRAQLGTFLPLRCGHNSPLRKDELAHMKIFLTKNGWL